MVTIGGLIGDKWHEFERSPDSAMGPALHEERDFGAGGRVQTFQNGVIAWLPSHGARCMVSLRRFDNEVIMFWGPTDPFNYDFWIVRWGWVEGMGTGETNAQQDLFPWQYPVSRTTGMKRFGAPVVHSIGSDGFRLNFTGIVQGCDDPGNAKCRQGWTPPLQIRV